jgi:hypothetical protein
MEDIARRLTFEAGEPGAHERAPRRAWSSPNVFRPATNRFQARLRSFSDRGSDGRYRVALIDEIADVC